MCEPTSARRVSTTYPEPLLGKRIWLIENDLQVVAAMRALLTRWGCSVVSAPDFPALSAQVHVATDPVDILLSDYHLDHQLRGLTVIQDIYAARGDATPAVIITADHSLDLKEQVRISGYELLHKPIKPHRLRALLTSLLTSAGGMG